MRGRSRDGRGKGHSSRVRRRSTGALDDRRRKSDKGSRGEPALRRSAVEPSPRLPTSRRRVTSCSGRRVSHCPKIALTGKGVPHTRSRAPAQVAELVDAHGSGPCAARRGGSSPLLGTIPLLSCCNYEFLWVFGRLLVHRSGSQWA